MSSTIPSWSAARHSQVLRPVDYQASFAQMPFSSGAGQPASDLIGEVLAVLVRPRPPGLIGYNLMVHNNAAGRQHLFSHA